ncbi:GNAT family N-acetyltransferase [Ancylobacter sp. 6x-1]|uniref:GNAT family N-acetyltransferase n=1 Tax=Ancylobacter crimeensis TaxID=2579147 RepID=A0ABT0DEJ6_9HYPH|nr:GNAT family N-acetyltransferase [Ancylobacter crimeensis]MCK0198289.1 GNAT family N-acetyltransferase [Ancylobacter crimeensis]
MNAHRPDRAPSPAALHLAFRDAGPDDRPAMLPLWVAAWQATLPAIDFAARVAWFEGRLDELAGSGAITRLAFDQRETGALAGFVVVSPATRYLDQLVIGPRWFGTGIADALLGEARRLSPAGLDLHVNQDNPRAVRFYEREGFVRREAGINPRSGLAIWRYEWRPA